MEARLDAVERLLQQLQAELSVKQHNQAQQQLPEQTKPLQESQASRATPAHEIAKPEQNTQPPSH